MKKLGRFFYFTVVAFTCIWMLLPPVTHAGPLNRTADVVIVNGEELPAVTGRPLDQVGLYAVAGGSLLPVPFQIDQRNEEGDLVFPNGEATSSDPDPTFDSDDELLFMVRDAGEKADAAALPADALAAAEIMVTDPVDGGTAYAYAVAFGSTAVKSDVDYVRYDPARNTIYAKNYTMGFSEEAPIAIGHLSLTPEGGGNNTNQADRLKVRFYAKLSVGDFEIKKDENGFTSKVIAWIDGPIRIVRRTKNRQTLFWKIPTPSAILDNIYYGNAFEFPTRVDLPFDVDTFLKNPTFRVSTDSLCSIPGRIWMNEKNPEPVAIDGVMSEGEKSLNKRPYKWMIVAQTAEGTKGAWMNRLLYDKHATPAVPLLYYNDDMSKPDPPETEPGQCGNVGYELENLEKVEKGVLNLTSIMYNIPDFDKSKIERYLNILDKPLQLKVKTIR